MKQEILHGASDLHANSHRLLTLYGFRYLSAQIDSDILMVVVGLMVLFFDRLESLYSVLGVIMTVYGLFAVRKYLRVRASIKKRELY